MDKETKREILLNGMRWANNILVEILSNYARSVSPEAADKLAKAISILEEAQYIMRKSC